MGWDDYVDQCQNGRGLIAVAGVVHDVTDFVNDHPGGKAMIKSGIGKDATAMFNGGVYFTRTPPTISSPLCASVSSEAEWRLRFGRKPNRRTRMPTLPKTRTANALSALASSLPRSSNLPP